MKLIVLSSLLIGLALGDVVNKEFLDGYNNFTGDIYLEVSKNNSYNFLISPLSIDVLLALAEYGSTGETSKQLMKGLRLPEDKEKIREAFTTLTPKLNSDGKYTLSSANKIYVKDTIPLLKDFQKFAEEVYNAPVESIDFLAADKAANTMNRWVEEQTHGKIKELMDKDQLGPDTRTVFLNSLYFRGNWVTKFNPKETSKDIFHLGDKSKTDVDFMTTTSKFKYFYDRKRFAAKFLELPYDGNDVTLTIVLPDNYGGLQSLENQIDEILAVEASRFKPHRVKVQIPKFKIETKTEFNDYLVNLGIVNAFDVTAKFPKITGEKLQINKVLQKAVIEVDEEGTTAAVASAVDTVARTAHVLPDEFIANHPYIFYLKYQSMVLFIGHYTGREN